MGLALMVVAGAAWVETAAVLDGPVAQSQTGAHDTSGAVDIDIARLICAQGHCQQVWPLWLMVLHPRVLHTGCMTAALGSSWWSAERIAAKQHAMQRFARQQQT